MLKLIGKKIFTKITYLAYRPNAKKKPDISKNNSVLKAQGKCVLADVICHWKWRQLDGVKSFYAEKRLQIHVKVCDTVQLLAVSSVQWRQVGRSWRLQMYLGRFLCVRIQKDQLQCVNSL